MIPRLSVPKHLRFLGRCFAVFALILLVGCKAAGHGSAGPGSGEPGSAGQAAGGDGVELASYRAYSEPLGPFFHEMEMLKRGRQQHVRIVQIGDSHTAADFFSGELRDRLQADFGNGGIGMRAAGMPYRGIRKKDMTLGQSGRWEYHDSLTDHAFSDYGISGFTAVSGAAGASLSLTATDPRGFDSAYVDFVRRPEGGALALYLDDRLVQTVSVAGTAGTLGRAYVSVKGQGAAQSLRVVADRRGIEILAWGTERSDRGVILDSFGVVGAEAGIVDNWNEGLARQELALMRPALIILSYGTNEGVEPDLDLGAYRAQYGAILDKFHSWAPTSALLVAGPTDGTRRNRKCGRSAACPWAVLPALDAVRKAQFDEAQSHDAAFWDASESQRRTGGMNAWARAVPPLGRPDHIHFMPAGYAIIGGDLDRWLESGFAARYGRKTSSAAP